MWVLLHTGLARNIIAVDNVIYGFDMGGTKHRCYKYDITNNSVELIAPMSYAFYDCGLEYYNGEIYLIGGTTGNEQNYFYKYNIANDTHIKLKNLPEKFFRGSTVIVNDKIFILGGTGDNMRNRIYSYNIGTNSFNLEYSNLPDTYDNICLIVGNNIYIIGGQGYYSGSSNNKKIFVYNIVTKEVNQLQTTIPYGCDYGSATICGTAIYISASHPDTAIEKLQVYAFDDYTTEDNSVILVQSGINKLGYGIKLFNSSMFIKPATYTITDVYYYTDNDGLITTIPTYYGDGTQWIKFKN